jgi:hypothetical protein
MQWLVVYQPHPPPTNLNRIDRNSANQVPGDHFSWKWQKTGPVSNIHYGGAINLSLYYCSCLDLRGMIGGEGGGGGSCSNYHQHTMQYSFHLSTFLPFNHSRRRLSFLAYWFSLRSFYWPLIIIILIIVFITPSTKWNNSKKRLPKKLCISSCEDKVLLLKRWIFCLLNMEERHLRCYF